MIARIEHMMGQAGFFQPRRQQFRFLNAGGADQHRLAALLAVFQHVHNRVIFFFRGAVNLIIVVFAADRHVGRHHQHIQSVNFQKFL